MDVDSVITEVASAVGLAEGASGVRDVIRAIARAEPVATRDISRMAELPVPIVTAVCNELRKCEVVDRGRPVRLTQAGRDAFAGGQRGLDARCPVCHGRGVASAKITEALQDDLERAAAAAPAAKPELDQTHCTVATKISRVLAMHEAGALDGSRIILLGDDDLISVAIARFAALTRAPDEIRRLTVVDSDPDVLSCVAAQTAGTGVAAETVRTQEMIAGMGLTVRAMMPNFNEYVGAGILAGTSHLYHLRATAALTPLIAGDYPGPLYTADLRAATTRPYRCAGCGAVHAVGPGAQWSRIASLQAAGCPACGGSVFRPMALQQR